MANKKQAKPRKARRKRCLIVERHRWETGGGEQQVQLVLDVAARFFGPGTATRRINVRVFPERYGAEPRYEKEITISRTYQNETRRINGFSELGSLPQCFIFFEETELRDTYDVWWDPNIVLVAAKFSRWIQARDSQYGRGRLTTILDAPVVPRWTDRLP